jgi:DNA-directed RNA polymerase specialized sigma24 family protein
VTKFSVVILTHNTREAMNTDEELFHARRYTELFERYRESLATYLTNQLRDRAAAEDTMQLVFMAVVRHRAEFKAGRYFRPWLLAFADRLGKVHRRRRKHERQNFAEYAIAVS